MLDTVGPQEEPMRALTTEEAAPRRRVIYVGRAVERSTTGADLLDSGGILAEHCLAIVVTLHQPHALTAAEIDGRPDLHHAEVLSPQR